MGGGWFYCTACGMMVWMGAGAVCPYTKHEHIPENEPVSAQHMGINMVVMNTTSGTHEFKPIILGTQATSPT
jgi:hypothetical protein